MAESDSIESSDNFNISEGSVVTSIITNCEQTLSSI